MGHSQISVEHVHTTSPKRFEGVTRDFRAQLGVFNAKAMQELYDGADLDIARTKLAAMAGSSGFALFNTSEHGLLLRLTGQLRKATQYVVGNPLIAMQMTQYDIRAALYAPLRVLVYEDEARNTCIEYDLPSSLFGQFKDDRVTKVALGLDEKMEALVTTALR